MSADVALVIRLILAIGLSWALTFTLGRRVLRFDWRGAGVVGGVCAGIALGPGVLGSVAPGIYRQLNVGAVEEEAALDAFVHDRIEDEAALETSGVSDIAIAEAVMMNDAKESALKAAVTLERMRFKYLPLALASALGLCALLLGCWVGFAPGVAGFRIGLLAGLLTALLWAVIARKLLGFELAESVAVGGVLAGGTCWSRGRWRWSVGAGSLVVALAMLAVGGAHKPAWAAATALGLGLMLSWTSPIGQHVKARLAFTAHALLVPVAAAITVSLCSIELTTAQFAFVMIAGVFAGDVHLVAGWVGINWFSSGRRVNYPATSWLGVYEQGWASTVLVLTTLLFADDFFYLTSLQKSTVGLAAAAFALSAEMKRPSTHRLMAMMRRDG